MITLAIPDMSCGHCRASVTETLTKVEGVATLTLDAENRRANVEGTADAATLIAALSRIGFPASPHP